MRGELHPDAVAALVRAVGEPHVSVAADARQAAARTTLPQATFPAAIIHPADAAQVQAVVQVARAHRLHLHPISRGRNWGYGDRNAARAGAVLVDLGRLDAIHHVDAELGYAVIGPGVTQGQLFAHLRDRGLPWRMDCTGAGPDASIVGCMVERGHGHSRLGDRYANSAAWQLVLGDGRIVETGFGAWNGRAAHVIKTGLGPILDGVVSQGGGAIITRATVWLMPAGGAFRGVFGTVRGDAGPLIEALRRLRQDGTMRSTVHVFSRMRLLGAVVGFPAAADPARPLDAAQPELVDQLCRQHGIADWSFSGCLDGEPGVVRAQARAVRRALRRVPGIERLIIASPTTLRLARLAARLLPRLRPLVAKLDLGWRLLAGEPDRETLRGAHWRAPRAPDATLDPLSSGAGMWWVAPILPATAADFARVESIARTVLHRHGFEHQATYNLVADRALCGVLSLTWDNSDAAAGARARAAHDALVDALADSGYIPYRGAGATVARLRPRAADHWDLAAHLVRQLDPDGVIAPGRWTEGGAA